MAVSNYTSIQLFKDTRAQLGTILQQLAAVAEQRGDEIIDNQSAAAKIANRSGDFRRLLADMLKERSQSVLQKTAFRLAVIGEFNSGKSTLINALLGYPILSTSYKPKTAAKTILRYGQKDAFRVTYNERYAAKNTDIIYTNNLAKDIEEVTSDDANVLIKGKSESVAAQIKQVEVWCRSEFLDRDETEIVDTPGLGSVFEEHKTVTYNLIPEMDATLILFPCDPGLGEKEVDLLNFIRQYINQLLFVMTKTDRLQPHERDEMLSFSKDAIENIIKIPVDRVYGVSAQRKIEGYTDESGFNVFLERLESFLVGSSGVARLEIPFTVAQTQCENLIKNTQLDIQRIDNDVESLREELKRLEEVQQEVEKSKQNLFNIIQKQMGIMAINALDGIDYLPLRIEKAVNKALDEFNKESLKKADIKIQSIINDTVEEWVKTKNESFIIQTQALQDIVENELKKYVQLIDDTTRLQFSDRQADNLNALDTSIVANGRGARLVLNTAKKAGGALTVGVGAAALSYYAVGSAAIPTLLPILATAWSLMWAFPVLLLLPALIPVVGDLAYGEQRIRSDIKKQLSKPIPGNQVTMFEAIVEGYLDKERKKHPGLRETLKTHFDEWSNNLKSEINDFVANLIATQLTQIEKQINDKVTNKFDREERLATHDKHLNSLKMISNEIADLKVAILSMSDTNTN
ncbi:MAG: dynamin family protein [Calothrix sp. FI2-JRJ7]|nr:dynamin family protein [Calothrix sp. FI2-JRJ7]